MEADWQARQQALAEALGARLVVAEGTTHTIADENPALVIGLVTEVVAAVIDPSTWSVDASPVAVAPDTEPTASTGRGIVSWSIDVGGRKLDVTCAGSGPTVLYELGGPYAEGGTENVNAGGPEIAAALGGRFCSYDRAGSSQSDPDPMGVRTFKEAAADLNAVLAGPDLGCPCVVIAESIGGGIALIALADDPSGFGGLVLASSPYPGYIDEFLALAPAGSPEAAYETDPYFTGQNEENIDLIAGLRQIVLPAQPPAIPIVVITHGKGHPHPCSDSDPCSESYPVEELETAWQAGQAAMTEALGARLVVAEGTSNDIGGENPELLIGLTIDMMAAATGT